MPLLQWEQRSPVNPPSQDEQLPELIEKLQGRFKAVASMMGCLQDYFPKAQAGKSQGSGSGPDPGSASGAGALNF